MTILRVNTEMIAAGATKLQNALDDIDNVLTMLGHDVGVMLDAWQGEAASANQAVHERFGKDATAIRNSLMEMRAALLRTYAIYTGQETEQTDDHVAMTGQIAR